jgi:hypothetical protein
MQPLLICAEVVAKAAFQEAFLSFGESQPGTLSRGRKLGKAHGLYSQAPGNLIVIYGLLYCVRVRINNPNDRSDEDIIPY